MAVQPDNASANERVGFRDPYTVYVMALMFVVYVFSYIDRQLMAALGQPIKEDLGLSDTQLGLLTGVAFAVFYATLGLPIARYADRNVRRNVIAAGMILWSALTALTGFTRTFATIALARIGVGVGEAAGGHSPDDRLDLDFHHCQVLSFETAFQCRAEAAQR